MWSCVCDCHQLCELCMFKIMVFHHTQLDYVARAVSRSCNSLNLSNRKAFAHSIVSLFHLDSLLIVTVVITLLLLSPTINHTHVHDFTASETIFRFLIERQEKKIPNEQNEKVFIHCDRIAKKEIRIQRNAEEEKLQLQMENLLENNTGNAHTSKMRKWRVGYTTFCHKIVNFTCDNICDNFYFFLLLLLFVGFANIVLCDEKRLLQLTTNNFCKAFCVGT